LIRVSRVADHLRLSPQGVRDLIRAKKLRGCKDPGGRWLVEASSVTEYLERYGRKKGGDLGQLGVERRLDELARSIDSLREAGALSARLLAATERERDRYRADAATAREAALRLVAASQETNSAASELLGGLQRQQDALIQLLAPASPADLSPANPE
jgi:excisionase family DNA binding protein